MKIKEIKNRYDEIFKEKIYKEKDIYYNLLAKLCEGKTLDVGCGNNASIITQATNCIGFDLSETAALQLHKSGYKTVVGDATYLPFKKESFNTVISLGSLEHFFKPLKTLREIHRVLIKKGLLILTVDAKKSFLFTTVHKVKSTCKKIKRVKLPEDQPIEKYFSKNKIINMLFETGFRIVFHGEYSKCFVQINKLEKLVNKIPFFLRSSSYVWVIFALKDIEGQEDIYGPYFPIRGFWKVKE